MAKRYYIAYGSNLNKQQMLARCPGAKPVGTSTLKDYRLMFKGSMTGSFLTIEPEDGCSVPVGIWEVTEADERSLDRYEGFPRSYYKQELTLPVKRIESGRTRKLTAFVYIMHEDRPFGIPSQGYMRACARGYLDFGFDIEALTKAFAFSRKKAGAEK